MPCRISAVDYGLGSHILSLLGMFRNFILTKWMWDVEQGEELKTQGRLQVVFIFFKTWDTREMEVPCKQTECTEGPSCSGAKGRIGV